MLLLSGDFLPPKSPNFGGHLSGDPHDPRRTRPPSNWQKSGGHLPVIPGDSGIAMGKKTWNSVFFFMTFNDFLFGGSLCY